MGKLNLEKYFTQYIVWHTISHCPGGSRWRPAFERRENDLEYDMDFGLKAKARIWLWLSYVLHVWSTAVRQVPNSRLAIFLFLFFTLVTGPTRSLSLKLSDARVYVPQIRAIRNHYQSDGIQIWLLITSDCITWNHYTSISHRPGTQSARSR